MARRLSAAATTQARWEVARRKASFTVSLIVAVPNSARAAPSASSSRSTGCFATAAVYAQAQAYRSLRPEQRRRSVDTRRLRRATSRSVHGVGAGSDADWSCLLG